MTGDQGVQKRECSFHLRLDGELDGGFNRVQFVVEQLNLFLGQGRMLARPVGRWIIG